MTVVVGWHGRAPAPAEEDGNEAPEMPHVAVRLQDAYDKDRCPNRGMPMGLPRRPFNRRVRSLEHEIQGAEGITIT